LAQIRSGRRANAAFDDIALVVEIKQVGPRCTWPQDTKAQQECSLLKKEPKNFCFLLALPKGTRDSMEKVFCFFFSKKKCLPFFFRRHKFDSYRYRLVAAIHASSGWSHSARG